MADEETPKPLAIWAAELEENRCWVAIRKMIQEMVNDSRNEADQLEYGTELHREKSYAGRHYFEVLELIDMKIENSTKKENQR